MKRKHLILACLFFMVVGYASVSTTLSLNGNSGIANKLDGFDVYFSDLLINEERNMIPVKDPHTLEFPPDFVDIDDIIEYDVTNSSPDYDADVDVVCTSENSDVKITNNFDSSKILESSETRKGNLTISNELKWVYYDSDESGTINIGDEVYLSSNTNEGFNIYDIDGDNVKLLAKKNLSTSYRQTSTTNDVVFSDTVGWEYEPGPKEIDVFTWSPNISTYLNSYLTYLKNNTGDSSISINLMTVAELQKLGCTGIDDYVDNFSSTCANTGHSWLLNNKNWWTRSAVATTNARAIWARYDDKVWEVQSNGQLYRWSSNEYSGVRPVITLNISKLKSTTVTCKIVAKAVENNELGGGTVPGPVVPLTEAEKFCCDKGFKYGMDFIMPYQSSDFDEYLATPAYTCSDNEDYDPYYNFDKDGNLIYTNDIDPQTFCENKGYSYGMYGANTYIASGWEEGDYEETVYLCAYDADFEFDVDGYDRDGNLVWQYISDIAM